MGSGTRRIPKNEDLHLEKPAPYGLAAVGRKRDSTRDRAERRPGRSGMIRTCQHRQADPKGKRPETREGRSERSTGSEVI